MIAHINAESSEICAVEMIHLLTIKPLCMIALCVMLTLACDENVQHSEKVR